MYKFLLKISLFLSVYLLLPMQLTAGDEMQAEALSFLRIRWANDIVYQTDYYFTNGLEVAWFSNRLHNDFWSKLHFGYSSDEQRLISFSLKQDIFTPRNVNARDIQYADRPYASYLLLANEQTVINTLQRYKRRTVLQAGVIGSLSGGEQVQNGIHELLPASKPVGGWQYQLATDVALSYGLHLEKAAFWSKYFRINTKVGGVLGIPYTDASGAVSFEIGQMPQTYGYPLLITGSQWFYYLRSEARLEYRLYDATIQGGLFQKGNPHTLNSITAFRYILGNSVIIGRKDFQVEFGHRWKSPEFNGARPHGYGYIAVQFAL